ncbi:MAG: noncanonical pyrimidine nucleotidase, YjjG family [Clostridiales bacterium]|nr:noncanonical pyrimidine nucleotidase, YjjG family [Clostridiales bacterium]
MPRYQYVLCDADNTLLDFDAAEQTAIRRTLERHGIPCPPETAALYRAINAALWARYDSGEGIVQEWLVTERFATLLRALGRAGDPRALNLTYLEHLGSQAILLPGAQALCRTLAQTCTLAIVTNGVAASQRRRFDRCALRPYISHLFISGEMGCQKPKRAFFDRVCQAMGIADRRQAVIVGDKLASDIQGGLNADIDTIWYNPQGRPGDPSVPPTWVAADFDAVRRIVLSG